jgi:hypothetical protein
MFDSIGQDDVWNVQDLLGDGSRLY